MMTTDEFDAAMKAAATDADKALVAVTFTGGNLNARYGQALAAEVRRLREENARLRSEAQQPPVAEQHD